MRLYTLKKYILAKYDLLFPTIEEVLLVKALGGRVITINRIRNKHTNLPMNIVVSRGTLLRREHFRRTGDRALVLSNDLKYVLAVQGYDYEHDVISSFERDQELTRQCDRFCSRYCQEHEWVIQYIPLRMLVNNPDKVKQKVQSFLYA